ncbi:transforming growth factor-beta-induced protein ig-h3 [Elysia marginata]|uniref:Transforming growth factor-beta-induced protein ig-h3 n=1 Tax=Elysia marginata TaxID=1093978 RepID=A0AAV4H3A3_9GAST|nr:transforming growth factor-beta-induced protein ig-h3 [Elysia marginata]
MTTSVSLREPFYSHGESQASDAAPSARGFDWTQQPGAMSLYNLFFNVHTGGARPWWEGPNVCQTENVEEKNATEGERSDGLEALTRHFSSSFQYCDESESVYKCTISKFFFSSSHTLGRVSKKVMTANCVPVVSRDNRASNGVIHTVEQLLPEVTESLMDMVKTRPDLSTLKTGAWN